MRHPHVCLSLLPCLLIAAACGDDDAPSYDASPAPGADATACMTVTGSAPADGAIDVDAAALGQISVQLSDSVDAQTTGGVVLTAGGQDVSASVVPSASDSTLLSVTPQDSFLAATDYVVTIPDGPTGLRSIVGLEMCAEETVSFTTAAAP